MGSGRGDRGKRVFEEVLGWLDGSLLITGHAGIGKSHLTRRILAELDSRGLTHVETAPTHAGAIQVGGITLHRFCHSRFSGKKIPRVEQDYLVVSEVGFCSVVLMSLLAEIRLANPGIGLFSRGTSTNSNLRWRAGTERALPRATSRIAL